MTARFCQHCGRPHSAETKRCPRTQLPLDEEGICGSQIDRYVIEKLLGSGGFGAVYLARHARTQARVAFKVLRPELVTEPTVLERFLREATIAASVGSEHLVKVVDAEVTADKVAFIAMEYVEGEDLKALLTRERRLHPARAVDLTCQVLRGLAAAHDKGVVHRDIKPGNVFITRTHDVHGRERELAKVLDFGISKVVGRAAITAAGVTIGTPSYMAWEQFTNAHEVDERTDLYAVAAMLWELLSGEKPYDAENIAALMEKVRHEDRRELRELCPSLPVPLCAVVEKGLAKKRERRWQSAREFCAALEKVTQLLDPAPPLAPHPDSVGTAKIPQPVDTHDAETIKG
ncbi:MAG: serine/threonine-protein kinase [Myxococcota bacterium]